MEEAANQSETFVVGDMCGRFLTMRFTLEVLYTPLVCRISMAIEGSYMGEVGFNYSGRHGCADSYRIKDHGFVYVC